MEEKILELKKYLEQYHKIFLLRHQRPDHDALGSQMGLYYILKKQYPDYEIYPYGDDDISEFSYLGHNIQVAESQMKNSLIIILDTANVERIEGNYKKINHDSNKIIKIDHHPELEPYGNLNLVDSKISSTSELIYTIFIENLNMSLDENSARALFTGIYSDTGGFSYSSTTSKTFKVVAELIKYDFDFEDLMLNIKEYDEESIRILGWLYLNINIENGLGIIKIDNKILKENKFNKKKISQLVNFLGIFKNLKAWVLMVEHDNFIRVNMRSKRDINVSKVANKYEGGGHKNASGAKVYTWEESNKLIDDLKTIIK